MQIYSERFYMSPKLGVRDGFRVNSYWFMPYSFIHSELINSYASPTCPPPLIPLTCRLRGKFYAYCAAVMLKRRHYLLTVSISIDTAVRIFFQYRLDHHSVLYNWYKRCPFVNRLPPQGRLSFQQGSKNVTRNLNIHIYTAFLGRLLSRQENRYGRPLCYYICEIIIGGNSRARLFGTGTVPPGSLFDTSSGVFLPNSVNLPAGHALTFAYSFAGVGPVPNGDP